MKRKRHAPEQIIRKLRTAEQILKQGQSVADACSSLEVSAPTYHRWQQLYGGLKATAAKRSRNWAWRMPGNASHCTQKHIRVAKAMED
ncbi:transposase [Cyanobium sp. FGCU-52]|nr:transposase [Cyanobium sp. FGCU52]